MSLKRTCIVKNKDVVSVDKKVVLYWDNAFMKQGIIKARTDKALTVYETNVIVSPKE